MTLAIPRIESGRYDDILDVVEHLGKRDYTSAGHAAATMIRQSPLFQETLKKLRADGDEATNQAD